MNRSYGFRGRIIPQAACEDVNEKFTIDGIDISIKDCVFEVGFDDPTLESKAHETAQNLINHWSLRNNVKLKINFNQTWRPDNNGGRDINLSLSDSITVTDRIMTTTIQKAMSYVISPTFDSYSFQNDISITRKALGNNVLADALKYYGEEVVENDLPLYGIYKAIEALTQSYVVDGRKESAKIVGKPKKYVDELMETANSNRHAGSNSRKLLSDEECKDRARILITAFANSL